MYDENKKHLPDMMEKFRRCKYRPSATSFGGIPVSGYICLTSSGLVSLFVCISVSLSVCLYVCMSVCMSLGHKFIFFGGIPVSWYICLTSSGLDSLSVS